MHKRPVIHIYIRQKSIFNQLKSFTEVKVGWRDYSFCHFCLIDVDYGSIYSEGTENKE